MTNHLPELAHQRVGESETSAVTAVKPPRMWYYFRTKSFCIGNRCWQRFPSVLAFSLAFKALNVIVLAPLAAGLLRYALSLWGRVSVGNFELAVFLLTRQFVDRATLQGVEVHAWTVNDPAQVGPLLDAGVSNLITDNPAGMRRQLEEIRALDVPARLLLRTAHALAN